jgi:hypothetical protein
MDSLKETRQRNAEEYQKALKKFESLTRQQEGITKEIYDLDVSCKRLDVDIADTTVCLRLRWCSGEFFSRGSPVKVELHKVEHLLALHSPIPPLLRPPAE